MSKDKTNTPNNTYNYNTLVPAYLDYLEYDLGLSPLTIKAKRKAILRCVDLIGWDGLMRLDRNLAIACKKQLFEATRVKDGKPLSLSTVNATFNHLRAFLTWADNNPNLPTAIDRNQIACLRLPRGQARAATSVSKQLHGSVESIATMLNQIDANSPVGNRDRALIAFIALTGCRVDTVRTLRVEDVNFAAGQVSINAKVVRTKNDKSYTACFMPVGAAFEGYVKEWVEYLKRECGFQPSDPLFPRLQSSWEGHTPIMRVTRQHWRKTEPINEVFKRKLKEAGMKVFTPHHVRHILTGHILTLGLSTEQMQCFSQSLGHSQMVTTMGSYGQVDARRQFHTMDELRKTYNAEPKQSLPSVRPIRDDTPRFGLTRRPFLTMRIRRPETVNHPVKSYYTERGNNRL